MGEWLKRRPRKPGDYGWSLDPTKEYRMVGIGKDRYGLHICHPWRYTFKDWESHYGKGYWYGPIELPLK